MLDPQTVYMNMSTMYPAQYDTLLVQANTGLQNIEDPRVRLNTVALNFVVVCRALGLNQAKVLEIVNRACDDAEKQDTAEMRGTYDFNRNEY